MCGGRQSNNGGAPLNQGGPLNLWVPETNHVPGGPLNQICLREPQTPDQSIIPQISPQDGGSVAMETEGSANYFSLDWDEWGDSVEGRFYRTELRLQEVEKDPTRKKLFQANFKSLKKYG